MLSAHPHRCAEEKRTQQEKEDGCGRLEEKEEDEEEELRMCLLRIDRPRNGTSRRQTKWQMRAFRNRRIHVWSKVGEKVSKNWSNLKKQRFQNTGKVQRNSITHRVCVFVCTGRSQVGSSVSLPFPLPLSSNFKLWRTKRRFPVCWTWFIHTQTPLFNIWGWSDEMILASQPVSCQCTDSRLERCYSICVCCLFFFPFFDYMVVAHHHSLIFSIIPPVFSHFVFPLLASVYSSVVFLRFLLFSWFTSKVRSTHAHALPTYQHKCN